MDVRHSELLGRNELYIYFDDIVSLSLSEGQVLLSRKPQFPPPGKPDVPSDSSHLFLGLSFPICKVRM